MIECTADEQSPAALLANELREIAPWPHSNSAFARTERVFVLVI